MTHRKAKPNELDQAGLTPLAAAILCTCTADEEEAERGLATIKALVEGGCSLEVKDSHLADVRSAIAGILRKPASKAIQSESSWMKPIEIEPTQYRGPIGFDATKLNASPLLLKIQNLLQSK